MTSTCIPRAGWRCLPFGVSVLLLAGCTAIGGHRHSNEHVVDVSQIDAIAAAALAEGPIAGLSIAVARGDELIVNKGYGVSNIERAAPTADDTVYDIASVTKLFTATAVMKLVDSGRLSLDDNLSTLLPSFPSEDQGHRITMRHLLSHTSGLADYEDSDTERWLSEGTPLTADFVLRYLHDRPLEFEPGSRWSYSNSGYYLASLIVERIVGRGFGEYVREEIAVPLGLTRTIQCDEVDLSERGTLGYEYADDAWVSSELHRPRNIVGDGGLCSTVADLVAVPAALRRSKLLSDDALAKMMRPTTAFDGPVVDYGLGVRLGELEGRTLWGHTGGMSTYWSVLAHYPDDDITIAVLVNTEGANEDALTIEGRVARVALGLAEPVLKDLTLAQRDIRALTGAYGDAAVGFEVFGRSGRLWRAANANDDRPPLRLLHQGNHVFGRADFPMDRVVFHVDNGRASGMSEYYNGFFVAYWPIVER